MHMISYAYDMPYAYDIMISLYQSLLEWYIIIIYGIMLACFDVKLSGYHIWFIFSSQLLRCNLRGNVRFTQLFIAVLKWQLEQRYMICVLFSLTAALVIMSIPGWSKLCVTHLVLSSTYSATFISHVPAQRRPICFIVDIGNNQLSATLGAEQSRLKMYLLLFTS